MAKRSRYGEETILVSIRVPKSRKDEILDKFYLLLNDYATLSSSQIEVKDAVVEKPAVGVLGVPKEKFGQEKNDDVGVSKLSTTQITKKDVDMDSLKAIGNGLKRFKCGCWIDEKQQLRRLKGSLCNLFKSEHKI